MADLHEPAVAIGVDDPALRHEIELAIAGAGGAVAGDATDGRTLLALCALLQPDVIVVDLAIAHTLGDTLLDRLLDTAAGAQLVVFEPALTARDLDPRRVRVVPRDDPETLDGVLAAVILTGAGITRR